MSTEEIRKLIASLRELATTTSWEHAAIRVLCNELEIAKSLTDKKVKYKDLTPSLFENVL